MISKSISPAPRGRGDGMEGDGAMGTDIHAVVQVQRDGRWENVPAPDTLYRRNYDLFAILGDVRNGRGFAGIRSGAGFRSIAPRRGLPPDFQGSPCFEGDCRHEEDDPTCLGWLGDHSHSWVTLTELDAYPWDTATIKCGVLTEDEYLTWDRVTEPPIYRLDRAYTGGGPVNLYHQFTATEYDTLAAQGRLPPCPAGIPDWARPHIQVRVAWSESCAECVGSFYTDVLPWLHTLGAPDDVRIVFGFDS